MLARATITINLTKTQIENHSEKITGSLSLEETLTAEVIYSWFPKLVRDEFNICEVFVSLK